MLVLCSACSRHVKTMPCPFCGGASSVGVRPMPGSRMSRAQLLAGAAFVTVAVAGCSSDDKPDDKTGSSSGSTQAVYGAPVLDDDGGTDGGTSGMAPVYGAPADDGGVIGSSSGAAAAYGAPPGDGGTL